MVESSADVNLAQLVGTQSGETLVPMYDWAQFLEPHFRVIPSIKSYHHFQFTSTLPGTVTLKKYSNSEDVHYKLCSSHWTPSPTVLPPIISPPGLTEERKLYLYQRLRTVLQGGDSRPCLSTTSVITSANIIPPPIFSLRVPITSEYTTKKAPYVFILWTAWTQQEDMHTVTLFVFYHRHHHCFCDWYRKKKKKTIKKINKYGACNTDA